MTDHTPTPEAAVCGARHYDAVGALLTCHLPLGHHTLHRAHTTPGERHTWADVPTETSSEVRGYCPACGGTSLFLGDGGYVTCSRLECPQPDAASTLLETDPRTTPEAPAISQMTADFVEAGKRMPDLYAKLTSALDLPPSVSWDEIVQVVAAVRAAHEEHRLAMSEALGLGTSAPWGYITDRARKLAADPLRRMLDSPVAGVADLAAAAREQADAAHEEHRRQLADALGLIDPRAWADMIDQVGVIRTAATERAAALHDARDELAAAGYPTDSNGWLILAPAIRKLAAERDAAVEGVRRAMQQRQEMAEERYALQQRADLADRVKRTAAKDAAYALKRAEQAEAALNRVWDLADRWEHALAADLPYARALRRALDGEQPDGGSVSNAISLPLVAPCARCGNATARCDAKGAFLCQRCHSIEQLSGTQPPEPAPSSREVCCVCGSPDVAYHNYRDQPFCADCAEGRQGDPVPETVPILDALVMETFAAFNRLLHHLNRKP